MKHITPHLNQSLPVAGFKAANAILIRWGLNALESSKVLGLSDAHYDEYTATPENARLTPEQLERVSLLLNIHSDLRKRFSNPDNIYGFMSMVNYNPYFGGRAPRDVIKSGLLSDLHETKTQIRNVFI